MYSRITQPMVDSGRRPERHQFKWLVRIRTIPIIYLYIYLCNCNYSCKDKKTSNNVVIIETATII